MGETVYIVKGLLLSFGTLTVYCIFALVGGHDCTKVQQEVELYRATSYYSYIKSQLENEAHAVLVVVIFKIEYSLK